MSKKAIVRIVAFAILAVVAIIAVQVYRRQHSDIMMELVLWPGVGGRRGHHIFYFVVDNNGILTSYSGRSRVHCHNIRPGNPLIPIIRQRERIALSEEDFQQISELVDAIVAGDTRRREASTDVRAVFLHNGNIYFNCTTWSGPIIDLIQIIRELTHFPVR